MIKRRIFLFVFFLSIWFGRVISQDRTLPNTSERYFQEGVSLFENGDYNAAKREFEKWRYNGLSNKTSKTRIHKVDYMTAVIESELDSINARLILGKFIDKYPGSVWMNRIVALMGSACFNQGDYMEALAWFDKCEPEQLNKKECSRMILHQAVSLIKTNRVSQGYIMLSALSIMGSDYSDEIIYYKAYSDYFEGRLEAAANGFRQSIESLEFSNWSLLYLSEISLRNNDYSESANLARAILESDPEISIRVEALRVLGESLSGLKNFGEAEAVLLEYDRESNSPQRSTIYQLGMSKYYNKDYNGAIEYLQRITFELDELAQYAYLHIALCALELNENNKARLAFEQASLIPGNQSVREQAMYNLALSVHETSYSPFAESVTVFEKFLNEFPASTYTDNVNSYLTDVYMSTNSYEAALSSIEKIRNPGPSILEAKQQLLYRKGIEQYVGGRYDDVTECMSEAIDLATYNKQTAADSYFWRAETFYREGQYTKAASDYYQYLTLTDNRGGEYYGLSMYGLGYVAYQQKNYSKALSEWKQFLRLTDTEKVSKGVVADIYARIGDCYFYDRQYNQAFDFYSKSVDANFPSGDYPLFQMGLVNGLRKNYAGKIDMLNRLTSEYPRSIFVISALYEQGRAYQQLEMSDNAIQTFQRIVDDYPLSDLARKSLAEISLILYQKDQFDEAIKSYKKVIDTYPGSEESRLALSDLRSIYIEIGNVQEFISYTSQIQDAIPLNIDEKDSLTYAAAEKSFSRGDKNSAKESFSSYIEQFPKGAFNANAKYYLGLLYQEDNDYENALDYYLSASEYKHSRFSEEALDRAAELSYAVGDFETSFRTYVQLSQKVVSGERVRYSNMGALRSADKLGRNIDVIQYVDKLLQTNLNETEQVEIRYYRAKALIRENLFDQAIVDLTMLKSDTRSLFGAESHYLLSQLYYDSEKLDEAEANILNFISEGTPHSYWLARSFILLSDIYKSQGKSIEARQYLLSLRQNYTGKDDISEMISERLTKLENE
ncbi:MAG TPA: tetratricopeptide repeat protein [Bacteroidaceae bacterium]|nr:tetratricopeptide repeat protein [Bacteroidaceae bacterium]